MNEAPWGSFYACDPERPSYATPDGPVWMCRKGQRVRFLDTDGVQVGPEHRNVVPAVLSAAYEGWIDPTAVELSIALNLDVRRRAVTR